jgi:hypothetical protein
MFANVSVEGNRVTADGLGNGPRVLPEEANRFLPVGGGTSRR